MKRLLSTALLCMLVSMTFAQKKAVKDAKKLMEQDKLTEAREMIKPALTNPETANDPETWKLAGDIEDRAFKNETRKQASGEKPNEDVLYSSLFNTWDIYLKADELSQIPDRKGKIDEKMRRNIALIMRTGHIYYINGGVFYNTKREYGKAADFFERYWNMPSLDIFKNDPIPLVTNDTLLQTIKYYAAVCAIQSKDHNRSIELLKRITSEPFVENKDYQESEIYERLANEYIQIGDSVKYIATLEDGAKRFAKSKYFVPNLINEMIKRSKLNEALLYLDQAIENDPENACELHSVKASIYTQNADYDNSFKSYEKALEADENCERALDGLAVAYIVKAQDLREKATQSAVSRAEQTQIDNEAKELYKQAYPLLEKLRLSAEARIVTEPDAKRELKSILYKLRNAYYMLNMDAEYDAVTKAYEDLDGDGE